MRPPTDIRPEVHDQIRKAINQALDEAAAARVDLTAESFTAIGRRAEEILEAPGVISTQWDANCPAIGFTGSCLELARKKGWRHA
jgi:hypothetical protein